MKRISRLLALILALCGMSAAAAAEILTIDTDTASYEELTAACELLQAERLERLKAAYSAERSTAAARGVMFRGVPWGSTPAEAEAVLGAPKGWSSSRIANMRGGAHTQGLGVQATYTGGTVAGYPFQYAELNFVYPVSEGLLLRDNSLAAFYFAEYYLDGIADVPATEEDLSTKLTGLYGSGERNQFGYPVWKDEDGNYVELITLSKGVIRLYYGSGQAETLVSRARDAALAEQAEAEALQRIQHQGDTDGL